MTRCADKKTITRAQNCVLIIGYRDRKNGLWVKSLWERACLARGWDKNDRAFRIEQFSLILGRPIQSASEIGYLTEFDEIKKRLLAWAHPDNLDAQIEMENMEKKRLLHRILNDFPASYILGLMHSDCFAGRTARPLSVKSIEDLELWPIQDLKDLRNTLCARFNSKSAMPSVPSTTPDDDTPF